MANLNLSTTGEKNVNAASLFSGGLLGVLIIFFLVVFLYAGLYFWRENLSSNIESIKQDYTTKTQTLLSGNSKSVVDFQNRLDISKGLIAEERNLTEHMSEVEKAIVSPVYLDSYAYDDTSGTITIEGVAEDYNLVAKQILGFKSSPYFTKVVAGESKLDSNTGKIIFKVIMTISKKEATTKSN